MTVSPIGTLVSSYRGTLHCTTARTYRVVVLAKDGVHSPDLSDLSECAADLPSPAQRRTRTPLSEPG